MLLYMLSYSESGVFSSFSFFITDGVAGENAPQQDEIKNIIESGGGSWIHGENELEEFLQQKKIISAKAPSSSITTKNIKTVKISKTAKSSNDLDSLISSTNVIDGKNIENNSTFIRNSTDKSIFLFEYFATNQSNEVSQKILFGCPGTGKSREILSIKNNLQAQITTLTSD